MESDGTPQSTQGLEGCSAFGNNRGVSHLQYFGTLYRHAGMAGDVERGQMS